MVTRMSRELKRRFAATMVQQLRVQFFRKAVLRTCVLEKDASR